MKILFVLCAVSGCLTSSDDANAVEQDVRASTNVLWQQPPLDGVIGHLFVPPAKTGTAAIGEFGLILWQRDPFTMSGLLVPTTWAAGDKTGFYPRTPELAFRDRVGSSTAQADGGTVGAYLDSADLISGSNESKMMITPQVEFAGTAVWANATLLRVALDLMVPVATDSSNNDSDTYANSDLKFAGPNGVTISYSAGLFHHSAKEPQPGCNLGTDPATQNFMVNCPALDGAEYMSLGTNSTAHLIAPWHSFQTFAYRISKAQFAAALLAVKTYAKQHSPDTVVSTTPEDYKLVEWHLNAELHYGGGRATLGFSENNARLTTD